MHSMVGESRRCRQGHGRGSRRSLCTIVCVVIIGLVSMSPSMIAAKSVSHKHEIEEGTRVEIDDLGNGGGIRGYMDILAHVEKSSEGKYHYGKKKGNKKKNGGNKKKKNNKDKKKNKKNRGNKKKNKKDKGKDSNSASTDGKKEETAPAPAPTTASDQHLTSSQ